MPRKLTFILCFSLLATCTASYAQETTATLNGNVLDPRGGAIPGASVLVKHEPTGYTIGTRTNNKGFFVLPNVKPGSPYTIIITSLGYKNDTIKNVNLALGSNDAGNLVLDPEQEALTEVIVTSAGRRSFPTNLIVKRSQLTTLPTLSRNLADFARLEPQANNNSYGGTNFRYNNLTIDGAINNDAIGFSNSFGGVSGGGQSGAAGSGTRTNPYSLDVIQEVQVQLAPYDVKLGNFTGGSVNAVTKSGTNQFHGSIYGYGRNQTLMGKSVDGQKKKIGADFYDYQYGATIGGPIVKDKAFFIVNFEQTRRQEPTFYNAGDPGSAVSVADATTIYNQLKTKYNYDAGSYLGAYKIFTNSDKVFARLDFNIDPKNTLTIRGIYTKGWGNNLERTSTNFQFGSTDFTQYTNNFNLTAELKTKFNNTVSNQFNVSYINVHEYRDFPGTLSPLMDIGGGAIWVGTWREASIYNMKQQTFELTDNVTFVKGINKFTLGTHNELYDLTYGFINSWNGRWEYANLNSFLADQPSRIRGAYTIDPTRYPNDRNSLYNNPPNPFKVALLSAYAQDELTIARNFKITPGVRVDYPMLNKDIPVDADFAKATSNTLNATYSSTAFNAFTNKWLGTPMLSPRIGFNWDVHEDQQLIVRGSAGVFAGRMPFAWLGYAETLTGGIYNNIDFKPSKTNTVNGNTTVPLAINPLYLKDTINAHALASANAANTREVDVVDNNFKLPRILRTNIAVDIKFGEGYKLTLDGMYTKTLYDVKFQQINIKDQVEYYTSGPTQSPVYVGGKLNNQYSNVYLLTNTREGYRYNLTAQLNKVYDPIAIGNGALNINWSAAYTYGVSKDLSNGIRNSFQSNFEVNPAVVPNNPQLAYSNFDLRHRIVATFETLINWSARQATSLAFFYSGQSGSPYSLVYNSGGNPFGNAANANLPYIPKDQSDIRLVDKGSYTAQQQWDDLNNLIEGDKYLKTRRGQYAERNGLRTPWNHELDMKLMHEFKLSITNKQHNLQLSFDVFNVLNLVNNDWGRITFVTNVNNYTVNVLNFVGYSVDANGNPVANANPTVTVGKPSSGYIPTFTFNKPTGLGGHYYTVDPINSRWQAQMGVKYNF